MVTQIPKHNNDKMKFKIGQRVRLLKALYGISIEETNKIGIFDSFWVFDNKNCNITIDTVSFRHFFIFP